MDVVWTAVVVMILNYITGSNTASISFVRGDVTAKKTSWDTLPKVLKEIYPPNKREFDPQSLDKNMPAMRNILGENEKLKRIVPEDVFFEGDIYLGPKGQRNAIVYESSLWPNGVVPYEIHSSFDADSVETIEDAISQFHTHTCIRFVPRSTETDYLHIYPSRGCWSGIGMGGGRQALSLGSGCTYHRTTPMHEFMHAVGFAHEQSRTDRDDYVYILRQNIEPGHEHNFEKYDTDFIQDLGSTYDYYSIMHYHSTAFSIDGTLSTITPKDNRVSPDDLGSSLDFTETDIYKLNALYNCNDDGGDEGGENNECGETHLLSSENSIEISSPNYPEDYSNNQDCTWIVTNTDGGNIQLSFSNFITESSYDYVQFGNGNTAVTSAAKYSGEVVPANFISSGDTAWIVFHSDGSNTNSGFVLTATAVGGRSNLLCVCSLE
ncbi:hatching enzyme 1.2-like [Glandiceps talaboti]